MSFALCPDNDDPIDNDGSTVTRFRELDTLGCSLVGSRYLYRVEKRNIVEIFRIFIFLVHF